MVSEGDRHYKGYFEVDIYNRNNYLFFGHIDQFHIGGYRILFGMFVLENSDKSQLHEMLMIILDKVLPMGENIFGLIHTTSILHLERNYDHLIDFQGEEFHLK